MHVGRYKILGKLATGGMAEVFLAQLSGTNGFEKRVVIKRVLPQYATEPDFLRLFEQEARFASYLVHPSIAQVSDFGVDAAGSAYLVMEYVEGASLRAVITAAQKANTNAHANPDSPSARFERPDVRLVCRIFSQVAEALGAVHAAVDPVTKKPLDLLHRDVSPENVLLSRQGAVKLADFGIARALNEISTTKPDAVRGKLRYLSPEQLLGGTQSPAVDVWALGVSLYETLALVRPFPENNEGQTIHSISRCEFPPLETRRADLPPELLTIVSTCLRADPQQRYPDCNELAMALERVASSGTASVTARLIGNWVDRLVPIDPTLKKVSSSDLQPVTSARLGEDLAEPQGVVQPSADGRAAFDFSATRPRAEPATVQPTVQPTVLPTVLPTVQPTPRAPDRAAEPGLAGAADEEFELVRAPPPEVTLMPDVEPSTRRRPRWPLVAAVALALLGGAAWYAKDRLVGVVQSVKASPQRTVLVTSVPSGATVKYGTLVKGVTPWAGDVSTLGPVELTIEHPGYVSQLRAVGASEASVHVVLKRR